MGNLINRNQFEKIVCAQLIPFNVSLLDVSVRQVGNNCSVTLHIKPQIRNLSEEDLLNIKNKLTQETVICFSDHNFLLELIEESIPSLWSLICEQVKEIFNELIGKKKN